MSLSPDTRDFVEARAICLLDEASNATPELAKQIADRLAPYAELIGLYGRPPVMEHAWNKIEEDTGIRTGLINLYMLNIASIHQSAVAYVANPDPRVLQYMQEQRALLRTHTVPPRLRALGDMAARAVVKPDFTRGSFAPSV